MRSYTVRIADGTMFVVRASVVEVITPDFHYDYYCRNCGQMLNTDFTTMTDGFSHSWETGWEVRTVHGYCKKCNSYCEYSD